MLCFGQHAVAVDKTQDRNISRTHSAILSRHIEDSVEKNKVDESIKQHFIKHYPGHECTGFVKNEKFLA